jgi:hypothetical protein
MTAVETTIKRSLTDCSQMHFFPTIDYRCDNRRFRLSAHNCQVPTPTQNLELEQQIRIFGAEWLINCLEDWHPQSLICTSSYQKRRIPRSWGWGLTNHAGWFFLSLRMNNCLERVNDWHFWNPGVFSNAMIPRCRPNSRVFWSSSHV